MVYITKKFIITGMTCEVCRSRVEKGVAALVGAKDVSVNLLTNSMTMNMEENLTVRDVIAKVEALGYGAEEILEDAGADSALDKLKQNREHNLKEAKKRLLGSFLFLIPLAALTFYYMETAPITVKVAEFALLIPILYFNRNYFKSGFRALLSKAPNMDSLVALGATASTAYGFFDSAGMIVTLITLGKFLELRAKGKASAALEKMAAILPKSARRAVGDSAEEVDVSKLKLGDIVIVAPFERAPADGIVVSGESALDESFLTGEATPVLKKEGYEIKAGSLNGAGALKVRVTSLAANSGVSKILKLVEDASASKPKLAMLADKVSGVFVPIVITLSIVVFFMWFALGESVDFALSMAISVLVISCPCALGLATPVAVMAGISKAAEMGLLIKNGEVLERASAVNIACFDKTGTLTQGKAEVAEVYPVDIDEEELVQKAASIEMVTEHPLARAVREYAAKRDIAPLRAENVQAVFGRGVKGEIGGREILFGNENLLLYENVSVEKLKGAAGRIAALGGTALFLAENKELKGLFGLFDQPKASAKEAISLLRKMNVTPIVLTGDSQKTAEAVSREIGIEQTIGNLLPEGKAKEVKRLQEAGHKVLMAGDGVNDAPSIMRADVGLAMAGGTEVAAESADGILIKNDLSSVVAVIDLSKKVVTTIKQNLFWAFFYNALAIPVAAGALYSSFGIKLTPALAAFAMSMSSLFVVTNSLRLKIRTINHETPPRESAQTAVSSAFPERGCAQASDYAEREGARAAEAIIKEEKFMEKTLSIKGMMCEHCKAHVTKALSSLDGVSSVEVDLEKGTAKVTTEKEIEDSVFEKAIVDAGYEYVK